MFNLLFEIDQGGGTIISRAKHSKVLELLV